MDELHHGKTVYEKEARDLFAKVKAKGIILIVIGGDRNVDHYEVTSMITGEEIRKVPGFLMALAVRIAHDVARLFTPSGLSN